MFYRWNRPSIIAATGVVTLLGIILANNAWAIDACRPATPCPCGVDGVCRPNILSWGYTQTRWRTWPGEKSLAATPDVADPGKSEMNLDPFERPLPEKEDQRGPVKKKTRKPGGNSAPQAPGLEIGPPQPAENAIQPGPAENIEDDAPDFELQGYQGPMPFSANDTPPALPKSLRQFSTQLLDNRMTQNLSPQPQQAVRYAMATTRELSVQPVRATPKAFRPQPVAHANINALKRPQLVNPAAGNITPAVELKNAVYFEATDVPSIFPEN